MHLKGDKSIFYPGDSTFSGIIIESVNCRVLIIPSLSWYVMKSHDSGFLFEMESFNCDRLEIHLATDDALC